MGVHTETLRPADVSSSSSDELDEAQTPTAPASTTTATTLSASADGDAHFSLETVLIGYTYTRLTVS